MYPAERPDPFPEDDDEEDEDDWDDWGGPEWTPLWWPEEEEE